MQKTLLLFVLLLFTAGCRYEYTIDEDILEEFNAQLFIKADDLFMFKNKHWVLIDSSVNIDYPISINQKQNIFYYYDFNTSSIRSKGFGGNKTESVVIRKKTVPIEINISSSGNILAYTTSCSDKKNIYIYKFSQAEEELIYSGKFYKFTWGHDDNHIIIITYTDILSLELTTQKCEKIYNDSAIYVKPLENSCIGIAKYKNEELVLSKINLNVERQEEFLGKYNFFPRGIQWTYTGEYVVYGRRNLSGIFRSGIEVNVIDIKSNKQYKLTEFEEYSPNIILTN